MDSLITMLIVWIATAPITYLVLRRFHRADFEKWTQMDRLFCLFVSIGCGPFGLIGTGLVALLVKLQASDWADEEAKW